MCLIERYSDDVNDLHAGVLVDQQIKRERVAIIQGLRRGGLWKSGNDIRQTIRISGLQFLFKLLIEWQHGDLELLRRRNGCNREIVTKREPSGRIDQHTMDQVIVVELSIGPKNWRDALKLRPCFSGIGPCRLASERHEPTFVQRHNQLTICTLLRARGKADRQQTNCGRERFTSHPDNSL